MTVRFFDVGQGDGAWIHTSDGYDVIVDAGPGATTSGTMIAKHLRERGIEQIDELHASHPDADHIRGLIKIVEDFPVGRYVHNGMPRDTLAFRELATAVATLGIPTVVARESEETQRWGCCVTARFLHPIEPPYADSNNASIVMRVTHGDVDVLFTGDIEQPAEQSILRRYRHRPELIESEILKVAHHGSRTSSTEDFLALVAPDDAVISSSAKSGFPHSEVVERLLRFGIEVLETRCSGDIELVSDGVSYSIEHTLRRCGMGEFGGLGAEESISGW